MAHGYKTGGRSKGTPNKLTQESKEILNCIVNKEIANLPKLLDELSPEKRAGILTRLMPYVIPKNTFPEYDQVIVVVSEDEMFL